MQSYISMLVMLAHLSQSYVKKSDLEAGKSALVLFPADLWFCSLVNICLFVWAYFIYVHPFFPPATINSPVTSSFLFMELSLLFWFAAKTSDFIWRGDTVAATFGEKRGMGLRGLQASLLQDVSNPLRFERKMTSKPVRTNNMNRPGRRRLKKSI